MGALRGSVVHAEIELVVCSGEVVVNGVPVVTNPAVEDSFTQSIPVNPLIVPGVNALELAVDLDPEAPSVCRRARRRTLPSGARAMAQLVRYPLTPGTFASPDQGELLARVEWRAADDRSDLSPREARMVVDLGEAFGHWVWQDSPALVLDSGTKLAAIGVLEEVRAAIRRGDVDGLLRLIEIKFREVRASYGAGDEEGERANLALWLKQFAASPDRVLPLDHEALDFRLAAEGRLLMPLTKSFGSAIMLRMSVDDEDGTPRGEVDVPYELTLASVGGALRVVR